MATLRQKKLAQNIVENVAKGLGKNKKELVASSGYGEVTARHHQKLIISQKGVKEELAILGFDEDSAKKVVGEILLDDGVEPQHRIRAASEIFKVSGSYAPEKHVNFNVTPIYAGRSIKSISEHSSNGKDISTDKED